MNRLFLIDGSSILSTSFYGTLDKSWYGGDKETAIKKMMKTSDGRFTNGVYEMTNKLLKLINNYGVQHMVVAFDVDRETLLRKEKYPLYKAHRPETPEELKPQFELMKEVLDSMGIKHFIVERHEADDIIGTLAKKFEKEMPVVVMTKDQDALQLISENTRVWLNTSKTKDMVAEYHAGLNPREYKVLHKFFEHTPDTFEHFYGLKPLQIIDKKALEGDKSDGIPGVKGCGEKAVLPLLGEFESIEDVYEYLESNDEKTAKAFLKELAPAASRAVKPLLENKDMAFLSKDLATIKVDLEDFSDLKLENLLIDLNKEKMTNKFLELEFKSLL